MAFSGDAARLYDLWSAGDRPVHERLTDLVQAHVVNYPVGDPIQVLSLGDGTGLPGLMIADHFRESGSQRNVTVISTDYTRDMTEQARQKARAKGFTKAGDEDMSNSAIFGPVMVRFVSPLSADDSALLRSEFPDDSIDVVVMSFSLMFVPDKKKCMQEITRMLKPGGKAIFVVLKSFYMLEKMAEVVKAVITPDEREQEPSIKIADCLVLNGEVGSGNSVEDIIASASDSLDSSRLRLESAESMRFPLPLCPTDNENLAVDMWAIMLSDDAWGAIDKLNKRRGGNSTNGEPVSTSSLRDVIMARLLQDLRENPRMRSDSEFRCDDYEPYVVTAVKER
eukprot:TRINITY_DN28282_c0_g1_i1.p1 TRINITY_DN28282_c0_g1~~TRINITY_DN28282_c0_g1_i1.p1  ORF type:complete len:346 (-),score=37.94 TRINITY_DN28282_c0_g1_i1:339-1352(-)